MRYDISMKISIFNPNRNKNRKESFLSCLTPILENSFSMQLKELSFEPTFAMEFSYTKKHSLVFQKF